MMKNIILIITAAIFLASCKQPAADPCFTHSSAIILANTAVTFNASCTKNIASRRYYKWNFGDGSKDTSVSSPTIIHTYPLAGTYAVSLKVPGGEDDLHGWGGTYTIQQVVTVH